LRASLNLLGYSGCKRYVGNVLLCNGIPSKLGSKVHRQNSQLEWRYLLYGKYFIKPFTQAIFVGIDHEDQGDA
jgi:hypothetical protein